MNDLITIKVKHELRAVSEDQIEDGFFEGWPNPPSKKKLIEVLQWSSKCAVAMNPEKKIIGFVTAISDGVLSSYIPLLEVLPAYRGQGIGKKLVEAIKKELSHLYMVDLSCDESLIPFYEKLGFSKRVSMIHRNYENQSGISHE